MRGFETYGIKRKFPPSRFGQMTVNLPKLMRLDQNGRLQDMPGLRRGDRKSAQNKL